MNITIEKPPVFALEYKDVELVRDLRVLGIFTYVKMMMQKGEYTVCVIVDKMKEQFLIDDKEMLDGLTVIIEELKLLSMAKNKED